MTNIKVQKITAALHQAMGPAVFTSTNMVLELIAKVVA